LIRDQQYYRRFENAVIANERLSHGQAIAIFEAMWQEAVELGVLPGPDATAGLETDIRVAGILNRCSSSCSPA